MLVLLRLFLAALVMYALPPQLKLVNPSQYRFEHLVTQMKWRLQEGRGEAVYQIGVEDNGLLVGLSEDELKASLKTLRRMAEKYVGSLPLGSRVG